MHAVHHWNPETSQVMDARRFDKLGLVVQSLVMVNSFNSDAMSLQADLTLN